MGSAGPGCRGIGGDEVGRDRPGAPTHVTPTRRPPDDDLDVPAARGVAERHDPVTLGGGDARTPIVTTSSPTALT